MVYVSHILWPSLTPYNSWEKTPSMERLIPYIWSTDGRHVSIRQDINTSLVQKNILVIYQVYDRYMNQYVIWQVHDRHIPSLNFLGFPDACSLSFFSFKMSTLSKVSLMVSMVWRHSVLYIKSNSCFESFDFAHLDCVTVWMLQNLKLSSYPGGNI
jgi:hypothetical protein